MKGALQVFGWALLIGVPAGIVAELTPGYEEAEARAVQLAKDRGMSMPMAERKGNAECGKHYYQVEVRGKSSLGRDLIFTICTDEDEDSWVLEES